MPKHTPGPWKAGKDVGYTHIVYDNDDLCVADVLTDSDEDTQLIAAAPDLLAACKAALADCEEDGYENSPLGLQLKAAIASAEGKGK